MEQLKDPENKEKTLHVLIDNHPCRIFTYLRHKLIQINDVLDYIFSYDYPLKNHLIIYSYLCDTYISVPPKDGCHEKFKMIHKSTNIDTKKDDLLNVLTSLDALKMYDTNIQAKIYSIYAQRKEILKYYETHIPTEFEIGYIISHDWIDGINILLSYHHIKFIKILEHIIKLSSNSPDYWELIKIDYQTMLESIITNCNTTKNDLIHIKKLFPCLYKKITHDADKFTSILIGQLNRVQLGYLLGFNILLRIPSLDECKELIKKLISDGPDTYYNNVKKLHKNKIETLYKDMKLVNNEDTLFIQLCEYSNFDVFFSTSNHGIIHAFTRPEFSSLYKDINNCPYNFYTRESLSTMAIREIESRKALVLKYNLFESKPLRQLYDIHLNPETLHCKYNINDRYIDDGLYQQLMNHPVSPESLNTTINSFTQYDQLLQFARSLFPGIQITDTDDGFNGYYNLEYYDDEDEDDDDEDEEDDEDDDEDDEDYEDDEDEDEVNRCYTLEYYSENEDDGFNGYRL